MTENNKAYKILIAEDEDTVRKAMKKTLQRAEEFTAEVETAIDGDKALEKVKEKNYDLVLSDHNMPGITGVELLKKVKKITPNAVRIIITGHQDLDTAKRAINEAQVHEYIEKPWDNEDLRFTIYENLRRKEEREAEEMGDEKKADKALRTLEDFQEDLTKSPSNKIDKEILVFEFKSEEDFNDFSLKLRKMKNATIEEVEAFENKYIIKVGLYPSTYEKIR